MYKFYIDAYNIDMYGDIYDFVQFIVLADGEDDALEDAYNMVSRNRYAIAKCEVCNV